MSTIFEEKNAKKSSFSVDVERICVIIKCKLENKMEKMMANITAFDRTNLKKLRSDIDAAIAAVGSAHGINLTLGTARFSSDNVTLKLEGSIISNGTVKTKGAIALERFYPGYVGKVVKLSNGKKGKVIEYHSRKSKFPFIVEVGNKRYKLPKYAIA